MGILDDALELQDAKRSRRLSQAARSAKIDSHKIKEGTYRGIDLTDGTARIQLDGQPNATSGYRLITNAPLGDGDRVSIRPNGVGLPRADARNVALQEENNLILCGAKIVFSFFSEELNFNETRVSSASQISSPTLRPVFQQDIFKWKSQRWIFEFPESRLLDVFFAQDEIGDLQVILARLPDTLIIRANAILTFTFQSSTFFGASKLEYQGRYFGAGNESFLEQKRISNDKFSIEIPWNFGVDLNRNERIVNLQFKFY